MCGFVAVYAHTAAAESSSARSESSAAEESNTGSDLCRQLERSLELIKHRGPDGCDVWVNAEATAGLGHCRLAINDISPSGSQPLHSADGQIHAVVIGEIYEYEELRRYCEGIGYTFGGRSDSELVLALYSIHGTPGLFRHLRGEFSFVIVDEREHARKVIAARDRFGIKPLFWTVQQGRVLFAAEAKAFLGLGWTPAWDAESIATSRWLADDRTMFRGVRKLAPGHWMEIGPESALSELRTRQYWDQQYSTNAAGDNGGKHDEASVARMVHSVREKLVDAVRVRLQADVPMGLYLSGGIDSSAVAGIVAHLVSQESRNFGSCGRDDSGHPPRIKCFTIGYTDATYDESDIAARTVKWLSERFGLQVECHRLEMDEQKLADNFEDSVYHTEHHIFDLNTTAKSALSSLPREHGIRSVLSGEGSDEQFAGYSYFTADFLQEADHSVAGSVLANDGLRRALQSRVISEMTDIVKPQGLEMRPQDAGLDLKSGMTLPAVLSLFPQGRVFADWVLAGRGSVPGSRLRSFFAAKDEMERWHPLHRSLYMWTKTLLPNTILTGLGDRSEMRNSIEGRPPFLDHHLAEHVNALPPSVKMRYSTDESVALAQGNADNYWWKGSGSGLRSVTEKWILREAVRPFVSEDMYRRRKVMFLAPIRWAKGGPLHLMFRRILTEESVRELGFVHWPFVQDALERGFGKAADGACFRTVVYAASWVTISDRFKKAQEQLRAEKA
ncbi:Asparagine synthetase (glutamine-hydrolyzing) 1 [Beauveria bassiana]|uniref:Asparagine synthetase (Glutamine-hydrolyzing) 1 n=1 Tax=Beauveria bassiana TaxID=176275 RepID=A0A2N6N7X9_BEABA|nr:Asparagine synthetase (glutamine-hydrolyzing) 1 [Beauveria bassiana]